MTVYQYLSARGRHWPGSTLLAIAWHNHPRKVPLFEESWDLKFKKKKLYRIAHSIIKCRTEKYHSWQIYSNTICSNCRIIMKIIFSISMTEHEFIRKGRQTLLRGGTDWKCNFHLIQIMRLYKKTFKYFYKLKSNKNYN